MPIELPQVLDVAAAGFVAVVDQLAEAQRNRSTGLRIDVPPWRKTQFDALEREQPGSVAGLLFAQIRGDGMKLAGLGDRELEGHGIAPTEVSWRQQLDDWQVALLLLADEYLQGRADVAPSSPRACQNCDLADVCRIGSALDGDSGDPGSDMEASA